jgi:hypothetical protein
MSVRRAIAEYDGLYFPSSQSLLCDGSEGRKGLCAKAKASKELKFGKR